MNVTTEQFHKLEESFKVISEYLYKATGDSDGRIINDLEKGMVRFVMREWNNTATKSIELALQQLDFRSNKPMTKTEAKNINIIIEKTFKPIERKVSNRLLQDITQIYKSNKRQSINKFGFRAIRKQEDDSDITPIVGISFNVSDRRTTKELARLHNIAIGDHYPQSAKPQVIKILNEARRQGLNKRETGIFLERELSRKLGGFLQTVPKSIKILGQRAQSNYFEGLAATTVTRARGFSDLNLMNEAGIERYVWRSIIDNRTSKICLQMDGRIFEIKTGMSQMNKILSMKSSDQLKKEFPWRRDLSEFGLGAGEKLSSREVSDKLAASGVLVVVPAHSLCRSSIEPA